MTIAENNNDNTILKSVMQQKEEQKQIEVEQKIQTNKIMSLSSLP